MNPCYLRFVDKLFLLTLFITAACHDQSFSVKGTDAIDPEHAVSTFQLADGFKIELIAAEPMVADPVDMEIDEYGNLYVVEMHGYPTDKSGNGNVVLLKDTDGDGRMDSRKVFADKLILPNGVMRWKKGIVVTDAPFVLYFEDTNNDGAADIRDTLLSGFSLSNPHVNVNNPVYGLDNWIYLAHRGAISTRNYEKEFGDKGSEVFYPDDPNGVRLPQNAGSQSVRFRPETFKLETTSSKAQFGHTFDAYGRYLLAENGNHSYQEVIANRYIQRNPNLVVSDATESMSDHGKVSEVFQITKVPERQLFSEVGVMTSSSGIISYLGGIFPAPYDQNITFVCESVSNLVHVDVLKDTGAAFRSSRVLPNSEFLASTDAWSRPVNLYIGPDGALYMVDYYRQIIEHPEWMSDEAVKAGGLYKGNDMGRIYRITPTSAPAAEWTTGFKAGNETSLQLVERLANPNIWWRINAQRLLVDRADSIAIPALIAMTRNANSPLGRLHALWTLQGLDKLNADIISRALKDPVAGLRENAIKLAEIHLSSSPELANQLFHLVNDPDARVRFQLLLTLGFLNTSKAAEIRNKILFNDISDKWIQIAAISASSSETPALLKEVIRRYRYDVPAYSSLVERLSTMEGNSGSTETIHQLIQTATSRDPQKKRLWQAPMLKGLAVGMKSRKTTSADSMAFKDKQVLLINTFFNNPVKDLRDASFQMLKVIGLENGPLTKTAMEKSVSIAGDTTLSVEKRSEALKFLSLQDASPHAAFLKTFIIPGEQLSIQLAALNTLTTISDNSICNYLLEQWPVLTPELRDVAIGTFLVNPIRVALLLQAIEKRKVDPASLGWTRKSQLMSHANDTLRKRARALLTKNDEVEVNKMYQKALEIEGDQVKGKTVYMKNCGTCHQIRGKMGNAYGPDLGTVHNWLPKNIMANVLSPNLSIAAGYDLWSIDLKSGESLQAIIASETSSAMTLRPGPGMERTINREDIVSLKNVNISAMTSGLEKQISQQEMADLLAFLRHNK